MIKLTRTDKVNIICNLHSEIEREFNITASGRVWPCCYFSNAWDKRYDKDSNEPIQLKNDDVIQQYLADDPDFNNLDKYDFKTIIKHEMFEKYVFTDGWNSDKQPVICQVECGSKINDQGQEVSSSEIDLFND